MKHFTIEEFTSSHTANVRGIKNNIPSQLVYNNLLALVDNVLDPARELSETAIRVNSGYRSPELNRAIGGARNSQHMRGEAADITSADNRRLFNIIRDALPFDQLIWEKGGRWIHVSYKRNGTNRKQVLYT